MAIKKETRNEPRLGSPLFAILAILLVVAGAAFWFLFMRPAPAQETPSLSAEARQYVGNLRLSDVAIEAKDSFMQSTLVEVKGKIANNGGRTLRLVEINCVFFDPYNREVFRERVPIVRARGEGLKPGESREFRLPFDAVPQAWNQAMPSLVIARIEFEN